MAVLSFAGSASAACPGVFNGASCNPNGTNICTMSGGGWTVTCELSPGTEDDYDTESWYTIGSGNTDFKAYGYEADFHSPFCCEYTVQDGCSANPITLTVNGSGRQDTINLVDTVNGQAMDCSNSYIWGEDEDDTIRGSNATTNTDFLHGGPNADVITGREGDDWIYGESGDDTCYGDAGIDWIEGGSGIDRIKAGADGDDVLGGTEDDLICGGAGDDTLSGDDGDDQVTGESGTDTNDGAAGPDTCETAGGVNCTVYVVGMTCPW